MTDAAELQALSSALGADVSIEGAEALLAYLDAMLDENQRINLTAVRERQAAVMLHALDSLALGASELGACELGAGGPQSAPLQALDLGTGNGFPGVAIACLFPDAAISLMDRRLKKLHAILRCLGTAGFDVERFEILHMDAAAGASEGHANRFDLITTRAVGPPESVGKLAKPLLAPNGRFIAWLSDETDSPARLRCGLSLVQSVEYDLPAPANRVRRIAVYGR